MIDRETILFVQASDAALLQSDDLRGKLLPPALPNEIAYPRPMVAVDAFGKEIEYHEGPVELEAYGTAEEDE
jgi:hypothetical protein